MSKIPTGPEPIELGQQNVFRRDKWNGDIRKPAAGNTDSTVEFDQVPAKVGENVNVVGEARLTECCAGPRTTDRIANSGRFERRTQRSESLPGGHHSRRYALRAGSGPNLVTAMRKLISVSSAPGYLWRAAARCKGIAGFPESDADVDALCRCHLRQPAKVDFTCFRGSVCRRHGLPIIPPNA